MELGKKLGCSTINELEVFSIYLSHQTHSLILDRTSKFYPTQWPIICIETTQKLALQKE